MLLITGVTGTVGGAVLAEIARGGARSRALYRSKEAAAAAPADTEAVVGDFADPASLAAALDGVDSVFLVCAPVPELVALETNVIVAAERAGVRRIVLNSALGAGDYPKSFPAWHRQVEDRLRATRLAWCILRPNSFMQNIPAFYAPSIRAEGAFYAALGDAPIAYIDVRDIAAVAATALAGGHDGQIYELSGPEGLSGAALAERIARHAGVAARYVAIPAEAQRRAMLDQGLPEWLATALLDLYAYYTGGQGGTPDGTLQRLLGHQPRTIDQFLMEHRAAFQPG